MEKARRVGGGGLDEAAEDPTMTAVTRAQHAKPWKSFPASSKTFMEFSQHIQRHTEGGEMEKENSLSPTHSPTLSLPPFFYYNQPLFLSHLVRGETGYCYPSVSNIIISDSIKGKGKPRIKPNLITKVNTTSNVVQDCVIAYDIVGADKSIESPTAWLEWWKKSLK